MPSKFHRPQKRCRNCHASLTTLHGNAVFCDSKCRLMHRATKQMNSPAPKKENWGVSCPICGFSFNPLNAQHVYCSDICRSAKRTADKRARHGCKPRVVLLQDTTNLDAKLKMKESLGRRMIQRAMKAKTTETGRS